LPYHHFLLVHPVKVGVQPIISDDPDQLVHTLKNIRNKLIVSNNLPNVHSLRNDPMAPNTQLQYEGNHSIMGIKKMEMITRPLLLFMPCLFEL